MSVPSVRAVEIAAYAITDPEAAPLVAELADEYFTRYGNTTEMTKYSPDEFAAPGGVLLLAREHGESVAGGAFRRYDGETAELKRVWTHSAHRRRGLAKLVLTALEAEAAARGYRRIFLTTGPKQPEAAGLYASTGYAAVDTSELDPEGYGLLAFEKRLTATGR
ncbi:GNAT family N-acetyltransferase [Amycolatopsis minnesotensis]|uniref:GNAT family N-acetyltransferase n=1 Tax=Amycolatopsis minnesotensis TaxID=337894 RepID=UPI0031DE92F2